MRIDLDRWEEIFITITRNKTRSLLTAFGVFWGIFMLVALMGGGQGLQDMMSANFKGFATNSVFFGSNKTSEAYKGFRKGRYWDMEFKLSLPISADGALLLFSETRKAPVPSEDCSLIMKR